MKKKFQNLEKLTMGIVLSKSEQKNALGGYGVGGNPKTITCYYIWEGCLPVGGGISVCAGHKRTGVIVNNSKCPAHDAALRLCNQVFGKTYKVACA